MTTLAELIDTRDEQPPVLVSFPGSETFRVNVRPLNGNMYQQFVEEATEPVWDEALMKKTNKFNREKFILLLGNYTCSGWDGLTAGDLRKLILIADFEKLAGLKESIAFDEEARRLLLTWSSVFQTWLQNTSLNVELFNREREELLKKK